MIESISSLINQIRQARPVILNITNLVTMDFIANGLLALGASPVMSQAEEEVEALAQLASALVINIGTLNPAFMNLAHRACQTANILNKPIILDPVGAGASAYRTESAYALASKYNIQIIRGNASEIAALSGMSIVSKGVDNSLATNEAADAAHTLAHSLDAVICVSGAVDLIVSPNQSIQGHTGSPIMPQVTGTGCLLSAVVAAFHAIEPDAFKAASLATHYYGLCGEKAAHQVNGPGQFKSRFIDALSQPIEA